MKFPPGAVSADPLAPALLDDQDKTALPKLYEKLYHVFQAPNVPPQYKDAVKDMSGPELRKTYYHSLRADHPDKIWQRFVKHHQYDLDKTFAHFLACLYWRARVKHVDDVIMGEGDAKPAAIAAGRVQGSAEERKNATAYTELFKKGEIYCHGKDKENRPICWVRVGKHSSSQSAETYEKYMLYHIETPRLFMPSLGWSTLLVFDMSGAGLRQMETAPLKSMLEFFDKYYPWGVSNMVVYNAPWVFGGLWKVIKGWIPGKDAGEFIFFAKNAKELEQYIDRHTIPKDMGGDDTWQYQYDSGNLEARAAKTNDAAGRDKAMEERLSIAAKFEQATEKWIKASQTGDKEPAAILEERENAVKELRTQYWQLDPYVRARGIYDDWGMIQPLTS